MASATLPAGGRMTSYAARRRARGRRLGDRREAAGLHGAPPSVVVAARTRAPTATRAAHPVPRRAHGVRVTVADYARSTICAWPISRFLASRSGRRADRRRGEALRSRGRCGRLRAALVCADAVGAITYSHDSTLEYLKTAGSSGAIGTFQRSITHGRTLSHERRCRSVLSSVKSTPPGGRAAPDRAAAQIKIADACATSARKPCSSTGAWA